MVLTMRIKIDGTLRSRIRREGRTVHDHPIHTRAKVWELHALVLSDPSANVYHPSQQRDSVNPAEGERARYEVREVR